MSSGGLRTEYEISFHRRDRLSGLRITVRLCSIADNEDSIQCAVYDLGRPDRDSFVLLREHGLQHTQHRSPCCPGNPLHTSLLSGNALWAVAGIVPVGLLSSCDRSVGIQKSQEGNRRPRHVAAAFQKRGLLHRPCQQNFPHGCAGGN